MESAEYPQQRGSHLPQPSRITSPGKALNEISDSQSNTRSQIPAPRSMLPPPKMLKHKPGNSVTEPDAKRKTLAERAGEPNTIPAPTNTRPAIKGTSLVGGLRQSATTSQLAAPRTMHSAGLSRATSVTSKSSKFSASVGPGTRRPQTSFGHRTTQSQSQSTTARSMSHTGRTRPASSLETHSDNSKGTVADFVTFDPPMSPNVTLRNGKIRSCRSMQSIGIAAETIREVSISTALSKLSINERLSQDYLSPLDARNMSRQASFSSLASKAESETVWNRRDQDGFRTPSRTFSKDSSTSVHSPTKTPKPGSLTPFLRKDSNVPNFTGFDVHSRLDDIEAMYSSLKESLSGSSKEQKGLEEAIALYKARINELELSRSQLQIEVDATRQQLTTARAAQEDDYRNHRNQIDDLERQHRRELDQLILDVDQLRRQLEQVRRDSSDELDRASRLHRDEIQDIEVKHEKELRELSQRHELELREVQSRQQAQLDAEQRERLREQEEFKTQYSLKQQDLYLEVQEKDREIQKLKAEVEGVQGQVERERAHSANLDQQLIGANSEIAHLKNQLSEVSRRVQFLESDSKAQSDSFKDIDRQLQEALENEKKWKEKLIKEETLRRILFNQVQELKGNIRVMCRVRPAFEEAQSVAQIDYPDLDKESKELVLHGQEEKSLMGNVTRKVNSFSFDRVFGPSCMNEEIFGEIQQLVQSALDGYNVCIFCYGQTGAGKTHTMSSADGMIPRAMQFIYETATQMQEKGWEYTMEGSFVEVYNEDIHDLLGNPKDLDKKKHEIRHDDVRKQTTVTGLKTVMLDSPAAVQSIMQRADENRSVAATKSNERSSRSHSVFILKLLGRNTANGETCEGTLNLVDLAGSERLKSSGAEGDRMKETQNINKSLSCLGDVIAALGQGKDGGHIPYRNSKLTYLLQYSLGGNSKTLMFVMISPLEQHLRETITSLKFATKVHNTHIGTAKKISKIRDRGSDSSGM